MQETWVRSLGWEDPLEKEMAIHSSTIAWKISWTEEPGRLQTVHGVAKSWTRLSNFNFILFKAEINKEINTCGGFPRGSAGQESSCNLGDLGLIPGLGRSFGAGHGNLLQYYCLENSMDKGA